MTITELRDKTENELTKLLLESQEKLRDLRFRVSRRELKAVHEIAKTRTLVARIKTMLASVKDRA